MMRSEVCQRCLDLFERPRYLEIGVNRGDTFQAIKAAEKVAVDPAFLFDMNEAARLDRTARYYEVESDRYFAEHATSLFDVVFIDGLHTYEQTLRDLMNSLMVVRPTSLIILDDVLPDGHSAAIPDHQTHLKVRAAIGDTNEAWMGDVYRLVYFIAAFMPMWSFATVAENHGQLIMWREPRPVRSMTVEATARVAYTDLVLDRSVFNIAPFATILQRIKASR